VTLPLSVEEGLKFIISGGIVAPPARQPEPIIEAALGRPS
jgi:uncharacterized membrane protein